MSYSPWIRMHDGGKLHILTPRRSEISISNIAWGLSHLCRYTGQCSDLYTIAQHSCIVSDMLPPRLKLTGLLHDAAEHGLADLNAPAKSVLPAYKELELRHEKVISRRFGLLFPFPSEIKVADMRALVWEMRWLMRGDDYKHFPYELPAGRLTCWSPHKARREFLRRFRALHR